MAWSSISSRLTSLPLLIAGPIVRRSETSSVSIWFVLKENRIVTLNIYDQKTGGNPILTSDINSGVAIGDHVFVYCVTASHSLSGVSLAPATNYYYDIDFGSGETLSKLISNGFDLTFDGSNRPSFALPPASLNLVRLAHGSCRKPHGEGYDAMEGIYDIIQSAVSGEIINAIDRPHQLFLTGDQIYADDVADMMLFMINDAGSVLFNWDEDYSPFKASELAPGKRNTNNRIRNDVGFTGMLPNKPQYSKSHLLKFKEYATMYLFVWSDVLWPSQNGMSPDFSNPLWIENGTDFPDFKRVFPNDTFRVVNPTSQQRTYANESAHVWRFRSTIGKLRKALANVPTFMIFDDHEITDDWNLNWQWCKEVYSKSLGRRTVQNGLLAYALFQAWGNTPEQFNEPNKSQLLTAAASWRGQEDSSFNTIKSLLNVPTIGEGDPISDFPHHSGIFFNWYYNIQSNDYAVYVQDSRTWRGYPSGRSNIAFAKLITQQGYDQQLPTTFPTKEIILVVAPCPVIGEPFIEEVQKGKSTWEERCDLDTEAWSLDNDGYQRLFSNLSSRLPIVGTGFTSQRSGRFAFLSGDVHYGLSARLQIWGNVFLDDPHAGVNTKVVFGQLTASSFKNQADGFSGVLALLRRGTLTLHNSGYPISILSAAANVEALPQPVHYFVWIIGSTSIIGRFRPGTPSGLWDYAPSSNGLFVRSLEQLHNDHVETLTLSPSWKYRIDWILGASTDTDPRRIATPSRITVPPSSSARSQALQDYLAMTRGHDSYTRDWGTGKEIVGVNNFGEIRFIFSGSNMMINHIMWWRMDAITGNLPLNLFPLTTFCIPMNFAGDSTSVPDSPQPITEPTYNGL